MIIPALWLTYICREKPCIMVDLHLQGISSGHDPCCLQTRLLQAIDVKKRVFHFLLFLLKNTFLTVF